MSEMELCRDSAKKLNVNQLTKHKLPLFHPATFGPGPSRVQLHWRDM